MIQQPRVSIVTFFTLKCATHFQWEAGLDCTQAGLIYYKALLMRLTYICCIFIFCKHAVVFSSGTVKYGLWIVMIGIIYYPSGLKNI